MGIRLDGIRVPLKARRDFLCCLIETASEDAIINCRYKKLLIERGGEF